jgi:hypothetical protein
MEISMPSYRNQMIGRLFILPHTLSSRRRPNIHWRGNTYDARAIDHHASTWLRLYIYYFVRTATESKRCYVKFMRNPLSFCRFPYASITKISIVYASRAKPALVSETISSFLLYYSICKKNTQVILGLEHVKFSKFDKFIWNHINIHIYNKYVNYGNALCN